MENEIKPHHCAALILAAASMALGSVMAVAFNTPVVLIPVAIIVVLSLAIIAAT